MPPLAPILRLDSKDYKVLDVISIRSLSSFPPPQTATGQTTAQDFGLHQRLTHKTPFGIGKRRGSDNRYTSFMENVNSWSAQESLTLAPLKQATTQPTGTIAYNRFKEESGKFFAMSRRLTLVGSQSVTRLYFINSSDSRGLTLPTPVVTTDIVYGFTTDPQVMTVAKGTAQTSKTYMVMYGPPNTHTVGFVIFIGPPMGAQTLAAQNWTLNVARKISDNTYTYLTALRLYVLRPLTNAVVGYIVGSASVFVYYTPTSDPTLTDTEQSFQGNAFAGAAVTVQQGDVLVAEIYGSVATSATSGTLYYGGTVVTTTANTTVSDHASFLEATNAITTSGDAPAKVAGRLGYYSAALTWTDSTIDTDTALNYPQAFVRSSRRIYALSAFPYSPISDLWAWTLDGLGWNAHGSTAGVSNFLGVDACLVGTTVYWLRLDDWTYPTKVDVMTGIGAGVVAYTIASTQIPRGIISFPNVAGTEKAWTTLPDGLYLESALLYTFRSPLSAYTGRVVRGAYTNNSGVTVDSLLFIDGRNVYQGFWSDNTFMVENRGAEKLFDGLPFERQGNVTDIEYIPESEALLFSVGGEDASHKTSVYMLAANGFRHVPYAHGTANRKILAVGHSRMALDTSTMHVSEDNGTPDDCDLFAFENFVENPETITGYKFCASGKVLTSISDMGFAGLKKGFLTFQTLADDLTSVASANEYLSIKFAHDGGSLGSAQVVGSDTSPAEVWSDGASTTVGTEAKLQQVEVELVRRASDSTKSPKVRSLTQTFFMPPQKSDGGLPLEIVVRVAMEEKDFRSLTGLSQVVSDVHTLASQGKLANLIIGQRTTKVRVTGISRAGQAKPAGVTVSTQSELPGYADLTLREII